MQLVSRVGLGGSQGPGGGTQGEESRQAED